MMIFRGYKKFIVKENLFLFVFIVVILLVMFFNVVEILIIFEGKKEDEMENIYKIDSLSMLIFIILLIINVFMIWFFKIWRFEFFYEIGVVMIFGVVVGVIIKYFESCSQRKLLVVKLKNCGNIIIVLKNVFVNINGIEYLYMLIGICFLFYIFLFDEGNEIEFKFFFNLEIFFYVFFFLIIFYVGYSF